MNKPWDKLAIKGKDELYFHIRNLNRYYELIDQSIKEDDLEGTMINYRGVLNAARQLNQISDVIFDKLSEMAYYQSHKKEEPHEEIRKVRRTIKR